MQEILNNILKQLMSGDLSCLNPNNIKIVSDEALRLLNKDKLDNYDIANASIIISISQIVYNNTDKSILFLDDGVYDVLLEKYKEYNKNFQVGAPVVNFNQNGELITDQDMIEPMSFIDAPDINSFVENSLYFDDLTAKPPLDINLYRDIDRTPSGKIISKRNIIEQLYLK